MRTERGGGQKKNVEEMREAEVEREGKKEKELEEGLVRGWGVGGCGEVGLERGGGACGARGGEER